MISPVFWVGFVALILVFLAIDLGLFHRKARVVSMKEALVWCVVWFCLAMGFNALVWQHFGSDAGLQFFTGYLIELSLSVDNLFIILVIFASFKVPGKYQHRVLFWGIMGALILRGAFILIGSELVAAYDWIFIVFGCLILYAAYRMQFQKEFNPKKSKVLRYLQRIIPFTNRIEGQRFFTKENGKRVATLLLLTLVCIEFIDLIFAFDSIPAIFAITTNPFIIYTSNIFAVLGLRSLFFVLADLQSLFIYLKNGLAIILLFIAIKLIIKPFGHQIPILSSLIFIILVLAISITFSLLAKTKRRKGTRSS